MAITYEDVTPVYANTTMQKVFINGVHKLYNITPVEGYVLRDKELDIIHTDPVTGEEIGRQIWYTPSTAQCLANYDFVTNEREFEAILRSEVPDGCGILGGGNNDHEVM